MKPRVFAIEQQQLILLLQKFFVFESQEVREFLIKRFLEELEAKQKERFVL